MTPAKILKLIDIDAFSATPKYQQLVNCIVQGIQQQKIKRGDLLPSINEVSYEFDVARVTVEKGYNHLRSMGILDSVPGKGYFIKSTEASQSLKIFLLFNKLSAHKKIIYDAFVETLGSQALIDFYIYNNDLAFFRRLIENRKTDYTHYVILPHFIEGEEMAVPILASLPQEQLVLMDKLPPGLQGNFSAVYEPFEKDIVQALQTALEPLAKYHTLKLIFPENSYHAREIREGFNSFCRNYAFKSTVVPEIENAEIHPGEVYINLREDDLVMLIEKIRAQGLRIGQDVGLISYNETPLKKLILDGITTISTDFAAMGRSAAELVLGRLHGRVENPFAVNLRASL
jgi:DNA-binding transcriptional regulator YhcF (GntR family)